MERDTDDATAQEPQRAEDETTLMPTSVVKTPDLAWSAADDAPTVAAYQPRRGRWLITIAAMLIGLAAAAGTSLYYTQQHQPRNPTTYPAPTVVPPPKPAPPPPPPSLSAMQAQDEQYVALMKSQGFTLKTTPLEAGNGARLVCRDLASGRANFDEIVNDVAAGPPEKPWSQAFKIVQTGIDVYCPQFSQH
jgi:hypothetical protein